LEKLLAIAPKYQVKSNKKIMNKHLFFIGVIFTLLGNYSCNGPKNNKISTPTKEILEVEKKESGKVTAPREKGKNITDFLPKGHIVFEKVYGDLNKDGLDDCILIIKGTDRSKIVKDEYRGELDRNRRGIIVLFSINGNYELAVKNYDCFSSENEDGGAYYAPELGIEANKGNLHINYAHGRYGYWDYTFRFQNSDFELIGYDASSNTGPIVNSEISINYLTKKKILKENTNEDIEEGGDEVFKQTVARINASKLTKLSEIKDFDELDVSEE
jgi:hypothetical protein